MFVRWQCRVRAERNDWALREVGDITWNAILVESVRVNGKVRQNHIAYLGSFSTRQAASQAQRVYTWEAMLERLDRLSRITPKDRKKIEAAIASKLGPRPTKRERTAVHRNAARTLAALEKALGWIELLGHQQSRLGVVGKPYVKLSLPSHELM
jgi:hypothetical protein